VPPCFDLQKLRRDLKPFRLHWFPRLRSTNDHAAVLRKRGDLFAPAIVLTGHQLAGRGRGSNTWWSGAGSLTVTFVLAADEHLAPHHVPLIAGLAVRAAAAEMSLNDDIQLKWPNDLLFGGRKLAGLLCERVHKADLIGVGLNVNVTSNDMPKTLRDRVTSLWQAKIENQRLRIEDRGSKTKSRSSILDPRSSTLCSQAPIDMTTALITIARNLHRMLAHRDDQSFAATLREYDQHHALIGKRVTVTGSPGEPPITGKCEGLDDTGRLLLRERRTLHRVIAGHVQMV
jgi:biotin-(acetyl-CoA carboxylase) ligase